MEYTKLESIYYQSREKYEETYNKRFASESSYRLDFNIKENKAFIFMDKEIVEKISNIYKYNIKLIKTKNEIPKIAIEQYTNKCLIDEIKLTNQIEGVYSTRKEIQNILKSNKEDKKRFSSLINKYKKLEESHIKIDTCNDIRKLYDEILLVEISKEDSKDKPDGNIFRKGPVFVTGRNGQIIHEGITPEEKIIDTMTKLLDFVNNHNSNPLIKIAVFHYMFGYIHPFYDGNGRLSRFISSYLLSQELERIVAYQLSKSIFSNTNGYYKMFKVTNDPINKGDLTYFIIRFLEIIEKSLIDLNEALIERKNKLDLFSKKIDLLAGEDDIKKQVMDMLLKNTLFGEEGLSVYELEELTDYGLTKIREVIRTLDEDKLLRIGKEGRKMLYDFDLDKLKLI
ncbi:MAG: Fic family protein [Tissierellales bacterium]|jgi:Fic family protein|nr:Fic family protein [Tissierellales bacterium]